MLILVVVLLKFNELNASIGSHMYEYYLNPKQNLAFDYDGYHDRVVGQKKIINLDKRVFKYYADKYVDTQLETIGKPKVNLQWIYNLVQMI